MLTLFIRFYIVGEIFMKFIGRFNRLILLFMLVFCVSSLTINAQKPNIRFDHLTIEEGLSQSSVFAILQDSRGFLWFGTQDGLNRYDGYNFKIYRAGNELDSTVLSNNWINCISEDQDSIIWIGCQEGGVNKFDPLTEKFKQYLHNPKEPGSLGANLVNSIFIDSKNTVWIGTTLGGLNRLNRETDTFKGYVHQENNDQSISDNSVLAIFEDHQNNLWIGTDQGGLNKFDRTTEQFKVYKHIPNRNTSLSNNKIYDIAEDSSGLIWVATDNGLNAFDTQSEKFTRFLHNKDDDKSISSNQIRTLQIDDEQQLWIGTYGDGLNFYDRKHNRFYNYKKDKTNRKSINDNVAYSMIQDNSGLIWLGTSNGVNKFGKTKFIHFQNMSNDPNSLSNNFLWSICEGSDGKIWIGTNGGGLDCFDRKSNRFKHYNKFPSNRILSVIEDNAGYLWIGMQTHGLVKYNRKTNSISHWMTEEGKPNSLPNNNVWALMEDQLGQIWVGTEVGLCIYYPQNGKFKTMNEQLKMDNHRVRTIYTDNDNNIWIGTYGAGMYKYDFKNKNFINYKNDPNNSESLSDNHVSSFFHDKQDRMWIGTSQGLNLFNKKEQKFKRYTTEDGLPNNVIYTILADANGNVWLATNRGLSCLNPENNSFRNFDVNDGLQSNEFNSGACCLLKNGQMLFGGVNGLNLFNPEDVQLSDFIAPVVFTSFKIFDQEVRMQQSLRALKYIELDYKKNFFSFEFSALDYSNPQKNKYKYMLEGFDKSWNQSSNRRFASYTNLNADDYIFKVCGSNSDGKWNPEPVTINITIIPPFWQTWYFRIFAIITLIILLITFYKIRMNRIRHQKEQLEILVKEQTEELRESYKETDDILDNVEEGLFLLNENLEFGMRYSRVLEDFLNEKNLASQNFLKVIDKYVSKEIAEESSDYLTLLVEGQHDAKLISDLNPLRKCKFTFGKDETDDENEKYLDFKFRPLEDTKNRKQLIVTVTNITQNVRLAQKLSEAENKTKQQMEWLMSILHVDPQMLNEFMDSFQKEFSAIQSLLKSKNAGISHSEILEKIYRSMHMIKGNASLLELNLFANLAHEFEDEVSVIKEKMEITGNDFVPLVMKMREMQDTFNGVKQLFARLSKVHNQLRPKRSYENELLVKSLKNLVNNLEKELKKEFELEDDNFNPDDIPFKYRLVTKDILIQLIRNSVVHGIETPDERKKLNKHPKGKLQIQTNLEIDNYTFCLRDDGRGLQISDLRKKAISLNKWDKEEIDNWDDQKVADLIFVSGISTSEKVGMTAGRGVGMDLVKQKVEQHRGQINIKFEKNKYCEFEITLPVN